MAFKYISYFAGRDNRAGAHDSIECCYETDLIRDLVFRKNFSAALIVVTINKITQIRHKSQIKIEKMLWKKLLIDYYCLLSFCCLFSSLGSHFRIFIKLHSLHSFLRMKNLFILFVLFLIFFVFLRKCLCVLLILYFDIEIDV